MEKRMILDARAWKGRNALAFFLAFSLVSSYIALPVQLARAEDVSTTTAVTSPESVSVDTTVESGSTDSTTTVSTDTDSLSTDGVGTGAVLGESIVRTSQNEQAGGSEAIVNPNAPTSLTGSMNVCKIVLDTQGNPVSGTAGTTFTVPWHDSSAGVPAATTFSMPLTLNTHLNISGLGEGNNADCVTYTGLPANGIYNYNAETISPTDGWATPKYNDQLNVTVSSLSDFEAWNSSDNSNGVINLGMTNGTRTFIVLNQLVDACPNLEGNQNFGDNCTPVTTATISATKIVCDNESDLPNWGAGGAADINVSTASNFLETHPNCHAQPGWNFEWSADGVGNPGDNTIGSGGAGWNVFSAPTNGSGVATASVPTGAMLWAREQMKTGYIPFTGQNTDQNVSAEFYCNSDVLHYDNWDWINPVASGQTYYCVAFNVPTQQQCGDHTTTIVSDTTDQVDSHAAALLSFIHPAWTASIPGANWIWSTDPVQNPTTDETKTFSKTFNVIGTPTSATLDVAADNSYTTTLNSFFDVFSDPTEFNYSAAGQDSYNALPYIHAGSNTLSFYVKNWGLPNATAASNPAGLLYRLTVNSNDCQQNPVPASLTVIKHVINDGGGTKTASDFTMNVTGTNVSTTSFAGSESGTTVTLDAGTYSVGENTDDTYTQTLSADCSGTIEAGQQKTCTVTNTYSGFNPNKGYVTIIKHVNNIHGGTKVASDFWLYVTGHAVPHHSYQGSETGVTIAFDNGTFEVQEKPQFGYTAVFSGDCHKPVHPGQHLTCTITNTDPDTTVYAPYCGDGQVNQTWESCDNGALNGTEGNSCTLQCQAVNQCTTMAFARAVNDHVSNTGDGDMTTDVFLGGNSYALNRIPSGTWFEIFDGTNYVVDPTMDGSRFVTWSAVPGLAIERQAGGTVRTAMYGYHKENTGGDSFYTGTEHTDGYLEFFNTTPLTQTGDTYTDWHIEREHDGVYGGQSNDEISISGQKSKFWLGVQPAEDSYFTTTSTPTTSGTCEQGNTCNPEVNLLANPSFETPVATANSGQWEIFPNGTPTLGWVVDWVASQTGTAGLEIQHGYSGWTPAAGDQFAELDGNHPTKIYQDVATIPGKKYTLTFSHSARPGTPTADNSLQVKWDGGFLALFNQDGSSLSNTSWQTDTYPDLQPTTTTTRVQFSDLGTDNTLGTFVDNVSLRCMGDATTGGGGDGGNNNTPPVIVLNGSADMSITIGGTYSEPGAIANDAEDGNGLTVTNITGSVNTSVLGDYVVTYNFTDSGSLPAPTVTRTVHVIPVVTTTGGGGNGGSIFDTGSTGTGGGGDTLGRVLGAATTGQVLGATTSCGVYLNKYLRFGYNNNKDEVMKLQTFLNQYLGTKLKINGTYDLATLSAVKKFQTLQDKDVLLPWNLKRTTPTGHVYITTRTAINNIMCPDLNLQIPNPLVQWSKNPNIVAEL